MTLRTQHDKPVYVRLRETIADAILDAAEAPPDPHGERGEEQCPAS